MDGGMEGRREGGREGGREGRREGERETGSETQSVITTEGMTHDNNPPLVDIGLRAKPPLYARARVCVCVCVLVHIHPSQPSTVSHMPSGFHAAQAQEGRARRGVCVCARACALQGPRALSLGACVYARAARNVAELSRRRPMEDGGLQDN